MKKQGSIIVAALGLIATTATATTQATNTNTVSPTLQVTVNVQSAVRLILSTGTSASPHCTVTATGGSPDFTMDFGQVDALGINVPTCGTHVTDPVLGAIYFSDYNLTATFTNQPVTTNTITAQVTTNFAVNSPASIVRDSANSSTVPTLFTDFTAVGVAAADTIASNAVSGTPLTRFLGVKIAPTNGTPVVSGAQNATLTFTLTVE